MREIQQLHLFCGVGMRHRIFYDPQATLKKAILRIDQSFLIRPVHK